MIVERSVCQCYSRQEMIDQSWTNVTRTLNADFVEPVFLMLMHWGARDPQSRSYAVSRQLANCFIVVVGVERVQNKRQHTNISYELPIAPDR